MQGNPSLLDITYSTLLNSESDESAGRLCAAVLGAGAAVGRREAQKVYVKVGVRSDTYVEIAPGPVEGRARGDVRLSGQPATR
ncbi:hypothetical protein GCM10010151_26020 [Actinoallomurus spadix]|uniref:Uncharacterized protein n=1 Tax=Actinoallomurus spadix TaxID=79912 RepID=A0ABN0WEW6_9ACTN